MRPFTLFTGIVAPLDRANVDTDQIIPKQFLKSIARTGFGPNLFDELRYLDQGYIGQDLSKRPLNPEFVLNIPPFDHAAILLARQNFGCGSSREHAPWALNDFGFRCVIAPSFADIFYNNCFKNGLLPIVLASRQVDELFELVHAQPGVEMTVDLSEQKLTLAGQTLHFDVPSQRKERLLQGLDEIGVTLGFAAQIKAYERERSQICPWLFNQDVQP